MSPLRAARTATPNRDTPSACAALSPFDRGDFDRSYPCRWAAPPRMKIIPLLWRGAGVGCPEPEGPTPKADAFCPSPEGILTEVPTFTMTKQD